MACFKVIIKLLINSSLYIWLSFILCLKNSLLWFAFFPLKFLLKNISKFVKRYCKKTYLTTTIKLVCLVTLCYHAYLLAYDYFTYPYQLKLIVGDNKDGFDVPQITVCTKQSIIL